MSVEEKILKLKELRDKIRYNTADESDYDLYDKLLHDGGYSNEEISKILAPAHISTIKDLKTVREKAKSKEEKNTIETIVVAGVLGLALGIIIGTALKSK